MKLFSQYITNHNMTSTIIENLSGRKLAILLSFLLLCQVTCFLIGGLVAPLPANAQTILGTVCKDTLKVQNDSSKWFYSRGKRACTKIEITGTHLDYSENDIVFAFQMPMPRENRILDFSRWQQNLIGVLQVDIRYHSHMEVQPRSLMTIDARLAYRNKGDLKDEWKLYTESVEKRHLDCDIPVKSEEHLYECSALPLFELGSLFHDYYLLNIRLPVDTPEMNAHIGHVQDMWLTVINQNGGFTKVWVSLKTVFFACIIAIISWFWRRVHILQRKPVLLEKMLLSLGISLCWLNMPFEYLTLHFDLPFMLLLRDLIQGVFYAMLFLFWLVFASEHMLYQDTATQSSLKQYWRHLSAVAMGCIFLFIFDVCKRGMQLKNPFYSIWVTDLGRNLALPLTILAGISSGGYFLFLCYIIWKVFVNISHKRQCLLTMSAGRRLYHAQIIYRLKFLMLATVLCAALTIIRFILGQVAERQWEWDENIQLEYTSAFFTGVYGMWNIYVFSLLVLYAPCRKRWQAAENMSDTLKIRI